MTVALLAPLLSSTLTILGPGVLSGANPGVLERVAERRLSGSLPAAMTMHGVDPAEYDVLAAPANCNLLGRSGWLVAGGQVKTVLVVDCEAPQHRGQLAERGLLADVNVEELWHRRGWLVLR